MNKTACRWMWAAAVLCGWASAALAGLAGAKSPVLLIGDSMMKLPGHALERELAKIPGVEAHSFSGIGTGLARLDAFDWLAKIDALCAEIQPKVAVVALGANDRQPMMLENVGLAQPGAPEWEAEYAVRLGRAMDHLLAGGCETVIWLQLPPMRDDVAAAHAQRINALVLAEAARRPRVVAHDFSPLVADRRTGGYADRRMDPQTAAAIQVRDVDGIHLAPEGARLLALSLAEEYWK